MYVFYTSFQDVKYECLQTEFSTKYWMKTIWHILLLNDMLHLKSIFHNANDIFKIHLSLLCLQMFDFLRLGLPVCFLAVSKCVKYPKGMKCVAFLILFKILLTLYFSEFYPFSCFVCPCLSCCCCIFLWKQVTDICNKVFKWNVLI